jgi:hypothetical protein
MHALQGASYQAASYNAPLQHLTPVVMQNAPQQYVQQQYAPQQAPQSTTQNVPYNIPIVPAF